MEHFCYRRGLTAILRYVRFYIYVYWIRQSFNKHINVLWLVSWSYLLYYCCTITYFTRGIRASLSLPFYKVELQVESTSCYICELRAVYEPSFVTTRQKPVKKIQMIRILILSWNNIYLLCLGAECIRMADTGLSTGKNCLLFAPVVALTS